MKKIFILIVFTAITGVIKAQSSGKLPVDPQVKYGKLDNGLTYFIRHNAYPEKRADFYITQKVGSMQEEDEQAGLAHFLEHMAFNGTKNFPGKKTMLNYLESIGVKFGANVNAYTELLNVFKKIEAEEIAPYTETLSNEPLITTMPTPGKVVDTTIDAKLGTTVWTLSSRHEKNRVQE